MSHHLLPPYGGERVLSATFSTRGQHHCDYMEQLRRSVEQLRHQTARGSPSACSSGSSAGSDSGRRSTASRHSDTLHQSSAGVPECLVVYEPHNVIVEGQGSGCKRYANTCNSDSSSSSSGSSSGSSLAGKLEDVSDIFEDSGVDLGFSNQLVCAKNTNAMEYASQQEPGDLQQRHMHNQPVQTTCQRQPECITKHSGMIHKSTHTQVSEFGGVCFCAVEVRKKKVDGRCTLEPSNALHNKKLNTVMVNGLAWGPNKQLRQKVMRKEIGSIIDSPRHLQGQAQSTSSLSIGGNLQATDPIYVDMSKAPRPVKVRQAFTVSNARVHSQHTTNPGDVSDDDTPTPTPSPEDTDAHAHARHNVSTHRCHSQSNACKNDTIVVCAEIHNQVINKSAPGRKSLNVDDAEYVQADSVSRVAVIGDSLGRNGARSRTNHCAMNAPAVGDMAIEVPSSGLHRSASVTSLISMTDTMSVTSLEVANLMATSTKEDKKSVVKLERERLQLQHQRLESYQNYADDSMPRSAWTDLKRKPYSDDSLKKQKIFQSVLAGLPETGPSMAAKGQQSNLHHFVTQSLQSFFETGPRKGTTTEKDVTASMDKGLDSEGKIMNGKSNQTHHGVEKHQKMPSGNYMNASTSSPKTPDQSVPLPSLFQLTASFRLFHVVYGDWTDLRCLRLHLSDIILEENLSSPIGISRSSGSTSRSTGSSSRSSGGSPGGRSSDSGAFRSVAKVSPSGRYTFLIISHLGNPRMDLDTGGLQIGDHIIEVNDVCLLNKTPEAFYSTLRKLDQVHLVIGRRRGGLSNQSEGFM